MGVIPGHIKNEVVIIGNHRDGTFWLLYFQILPIDFLLAKKLG